MNLGLQRGTVTVVKYDPIWPELFEKERLLLAASFGDELSAIEHVGSTAVPGLDAKPIIDIIGSVKSFDNLEYFIKTLRTLGYEYMPDRMFKDRKFFPKGPQKNRTHHLNLVIEGDQAQWYDILLFRDYLRQNEAVRDEYSHLKNMLAHTYSKDRSAYTKAKNDFIQQCLRAAS